MLNDEMLSRVAASIAKGQEATLSEAANQARRERIATAALTGMLACHDSGRYTLEAMAIDAVKAADCLIAELDRPSPVPAEPTP